MAAVGLAFLVSAAAGEVDPKIESIKERIKDSGGLRVRDRGGIESVEIWLNKNCDDHLKTVKELKNIRRLQLCGDAGGKGFGDVTDKGLEQLKSMRDLEHLDLTLSKKFTDAGLEHLKRLNKLATLNLAHTNITDAGLARLKAIKNLQSLDLRGTKITDAGLAHLGDLPRLRVLELNQTEVSDEGLKHLQALKTLTSIGFQECTGVTDKGMEVLQQLTRLERLDLYGTHITDDGLRRLSALPNLQSLSLAQTEVTPAGCAEFKKAHPKTKVEYAAK
jgi:Leucine-rich repeat (LRR) protein